MKTIAILGAGPGLGAAVALRWARQGYAVSLVGRRRASLDALAANIPGARVIPADLADPAAVPRLAEQLGDVDALYYAPTPAGDFVPAAKLTPQYAEQFLPLTFYTLVALVQEFLPGMLARGDGTILTAQGASSTKGPPNLSGPGPAQAAQRNYLQSLHAEVAEQGVYVGMLYIGAAIRHSAFHTQWQAAGDPAWEMPVVEPADLADLLWAMTQTRDRAEATYP